MVGMCHCTYISASFLSQHRRLVMNSSDRTLRQFTVPNYQVPLSPLPDDNINNTNRSSSSSSSPSSSSRSTPALRTASTASNVNEQELEPTHRFHDPINKTAWHNMAYSPDGEWLAGGELWFRALTPDTNSIFFAVPG